MKRKLKKFVRNLPGHEGWWKSENENHYIGCGYILLKEGLSLVQIEGILERLYTAAIDEYGA